MRTRNKIAIAILGAIVLLLLALQTPLLHHARSVAWTVWLSSIARIFNIGPLQEDVSLNNQLKALQAENIRLQAASREYQMLKEQLGEHSFETFRSIPAIVSARPSDTFQNQFIVNKGVQNGVTQGAPVVVYGSNLVGLITEVYEHSAVVELLLHPSTNITARVLNEDGPQGLLVGRHYTSLALTTIPQDVNLAQGDQVVTIGSELIPAGLVLGGITSVARDENAAYQEAVVALPFDPARIRAVSILVLP